MVSIPYQKEPPAFGARWTSAMDSSISLICEKFSLAITTSKYSLGYSSNLPFVRNFCNSFNRCRLFNLLKNSDSIRTHASAFASLELYQSIISGRLGLGDTYRSPHSHRFPVNPFSSQAMRCDPLPQKMQPISISLILLKGFCPANYPFVTVVMVDSDIYKFPVLKVILLLETLYNTSEMQD